MKPRGSAARTDSSSCQTEPSSSCLQPNRWLSSDSCLTVQRWHSTRCTPIRLKARCLLCTAPLIALITRTISSVWISLSYRHKVFAVDSRADGLETEVLTETRQQKADESTRCWLRKVWSKDETETLCWLSAKKTEFVESLWVSVTGSTSNMN